MKLNNFLNRFEDTKKIDPESWDSKTYWPYSILYICIEFAFFTAAIFALTILGIIILEKILVSFQIEIYISYWNALYVGLIFALGRAVQQWSITETVVNVPVGFTGLAKIKGKTQGESTTMRTLTEGDFSALPNRFGYRKKELFKIDIVPLEYPNQDVAAVNVNANDGIFLAVDSAISYKLVNPFKVLKLMSLIFKDKKSISDITYEIRRRAQDVLLEAINNTTDNMSHEAILSAGEGVDGTELFNEQFNKELKKIQRLSERKPYFSSGTKSLMKNEHFLEEIGLNISINIQTITPMSEDIRKALMETAVSAAEKLKTIAKGEGDAEAERLMLDMTSETFAKWRKHYRDVLGMTHKDASHKAALATNLWATEVLSDIGSSDGTSIASKGNGGFIEKIFAMIKAYKASDGEK